jgi:hypothetical protein
MGLPTSLSARKRPRPHAICTTDYFTAATVSPQRSSTPVLPYRDAMQPFLKWIRTRTAACPRGRADHSASRLLLALIGSLDYLLKKEKKEKKKKHHTRRIMHGNKESCLRK